MKGLVCPHQKRINVKRRLGLSIYEHARDGEGCNLLNRFNVRHSSLLNQVVQKSHFADTPKVRAAIAASPPNRRALYRAVASKMDRKELKAYCQILVSVCRVSNEAKADANAVLGIAFANLCKHLNVDMGGVYWRNVNGTMPIKYAEKWVKSDMEGAVDELREALERSRPRPRFIPIYTS